MEKTFGNLLEAQAYFNSEEKCWQHLEQSRWNGKPVCPYCGVDKAPYKLKGFKKYRCSDKDCKQTFTAAIGTIFEGTHIPLQKWYLAIYLATAHKKGISSLQLGRDLSVSKHTAWYLLHRVREMLNGKAPVLLEGTVQIDCTFIGGKLHYKSNAKRKAIRAKYEGKVPNEDSKTTVLGILDGTTLHHQIVESEEAAYVLPEMRKRVKEGSTIVTDQRNFYSNLSDKYNHVSVNHGESEYVKNGFTTNGIEGAFSLLKRSIYGIYHSVSAKHLHRYCAETAYRYNTREKTDAERFNHSLIQAEGKRLTYKRLINKQQPLASAETPTV
jgi:transposase-like protein